MCGLVGLHLKEPDFIKSERESQKLEKFFDELLVGIITRGTDATGFVAVSKDNKTILDKNNIPATVFVEKRAKFPEGVRTVLGHTRLETQGSAKNWANNHPVMYRTTFVTHNGMIRNDDSLFKKEKLNRFGQVDTEIIAALFNKYGLDKYGVVANKLNGGFAVAAIDPHKYPQRIILLRDSIMPLHYLENKNFIVWASTIQAMREAWDKTLGHAPSHNMFKSLEPGSVLDIKGSEVELNKAAFKTAYSGYSGYYNRGWEDDDFLMEDYRSHHERRHPSAARRLPNQEVKPIKEKILEWEKKGLLEATTWEDRKDMDEELLKITSGNWLFCFSCNRTIFKDDFWVTPSEKLCIDCKEIKDVLANGNRKNLILEGITKKTIDDLEEWVEIEGAVHYIALNKVSEETDLSPQAVDYILFRDGDYRKGSEQHKKLYDLIAKIYDKKQQEAWVDYSDECVVDDEIDYSEDHDVESFRDPDNLTIYVNCGAGTHPKGEACDACDAFEHAIKKDNVSKFCACTTVNGELIKCTVHESLNSVGRRVNHTQGSATICTTKIKSRNCKGCFRCKTHDPNKCFYPDCKKKIKVTISDFAWCGKHMRCQAIGKCQHEPKGASPDGKVWCHYHIRSKSGARSFKDKYAWF